MSHGLPLGEGKVTIRPGFSGTVPIFNLKSRKKSEVSRDANLSRFWPGVPDLSRFNKLLSCSEYWTRAVLWVLTIHTVRPDRCIWNACTSAIAPVKFTYLSLGSAWRTFAREIECAMTLRFTSVEIIRWKCEHVAVDKRWVELFTHFHQQDIPCANVFKMVEFCLNLPGTNAATERVFSLMNDVCTLQFA